MVYMKPSVIHSFSDIAIHPVGTPASLPQMLFTVLVVVDIPEKKRVTVGNGLLCHRVQDSATTDSYAI